MISPIIGRFPVLRAFVAALTLTLAAGARADTIFFDNTDSPIVSGSFIAAFVSQNVRIKTDGFAPGDNLAYIDIWLTPFNVPDGKLPNLLLYEDNAGTLGSLLTSAKLDAGIPNSPDLQQVRVNFDHGPALQDETNYWIGMNFDAGATGSFAWATSLDAQMTFLAFITAGGTNYVGTHNVPHIQMVGKSAAVPDGGSVAVYLGMLVAAAALVRRFRPGLSTAAA
jgi:hypothetical protein